MNKKGLFFYVVVPIVLIVVVATFLHYPIHIQNVLTLEEAPDMLIEISVWRVLFEPILGLMLYFNRSLYGIMEIEYLLVWIFIGVILITLLKVRTLQHESKGRFILRKTFNLPVLIGLLFAVFVVMLFLPLPNNRIVNISKNEVLVTTHTHTEYSHDGLITQQKLWEWHKRNGFDALFITDHNNHAKTVEFVNKQRSGKLPISPLVMAGEEFSGTNHMSLLGLKGNFITKGMADTTIINKVHAGGGAVIINHWFDDENMSLDYYKSVGADGFEIENTATDKKYDRGMFDQIKNYCQNNGLIMNGGLDFHGYGNVCSLWNAFDIPGWDSMSAEDKEASILGIIRNGDQSKLQVLMYNDRPFYEKGNLFFRPIITVFNYFRTLNVWQVLSWAFWLVVFYTALPFIKQLKADKVISIVAILTSLFLIGLGINYFIHQRLVPGYTDVYEEYGNILVITGGILLAYSLVLSYFRLFRKA